MASICSVNYLQLLHFYIVEVLRLFYNKSGEYIKTNVPSLRDELNLLSVPVARKEIFIKFIAVLKPRFHNYLPEEIKDMPYKPLFSRHVKDCLYLLVKESVSSHIYSLITDFTCFSFSSNINLFCFLILVISSVVFALH